MRPAWRPQASSAPDEQSPDLPEIVTFSEHQNTPPRGKRKREQEGYVGCQSVCKSTLSLIICRAGCRWLDTAVDYVKAKLYPLYKDGVGGPKLSKERYKSIVRQVTHLFKSEATAFQSPILSKPGQLSNLAKDRLKKLIDQVYKASKSKDARTTQLDRTSSRVPSVGSTIVSSYSAVPTTGSTFR